VNVSKHKYLDSKIIQLYDSGLSMKSVAQLVGLGSSTVEYRLKIHKKNRSKSQAMAGKSKSIAHRQNLSNKKRSCQRRA
jgi:transposase